MRRRAPLLVAALLTLACGSEDPSFEPGPLVQPTAWLASPTENDPLAAHRPTEVLCPQAAWSVEESTLEVSTGECNYLSVEQPLLRDVPEGAVIEVNLWHQTLFASEAAVGHAALVVDGELLWEREIPIPAPAQIWRDEVLAPRNMAAGERVVFHLHNHGVNTWRLGDVLLLD